MTAQPAKESIVILSCGQATTGCKDEASGAFQAASALDGRLRPSTGC